MSTNEPNKSPENLIREEQPNGVVKFRPRFSPLLNSIFSNMSKEDKLELLRKPEKTQIAQLKQLYKAQFLEMEYEDRQGILKKLTFNSSVYDVDKMAEYLTNDFEEEKEKENDEEEEDENKNENNFKIGKQNKSNQKDVNPRQQLLLISQQLIQSQKGKYNNYEMEVKFGTRGVKMLTKQDYDNTVKKLKDMGFMPNQSDGYYCLKIQPEFLDFRTGEFKSSNDLDRFRIEINGLANIQEYCRTNNLEQLLNTKTSQEVSIMKKTDVKIGEEIINSADFNDFNFRVTYKNEEYISKNSKMALELLSNWNKSRKIYRYINRVTFEHRDYPFKID